jgi:hypothetical protein
MPHAESGNGDRVGTVPDPASRAATGDASPADDLARLKHLLLDDERRALDALDARVAALDRNQRELPARLPGALERAQDGAGAERMARALARPVTHALGAAVRDNRQVIVDVLFPVIGPAIRKAIAEALRNLVTDVNGALESSLTPRGLAWRFEAWRSGVPYAQIVLRHTLNYQIDHVFLIQRDSGLVLDRESAPGLPSLDADAIAGMLTAIGEFVRDSVGRAEGGTLDSARVGEHLLWVVQGPRANLACFMRGVPPSGLHALLEQRLEEIHARLGDTGAHADGEAEWRASLRPEEIMQEERAAGTQPRPASSRAPMIAILAIAAIALGWFWMRHARQSAWLDELRTRLATHPGFVLTGIDAHGGPVTVHGLLDPDAEPLAPLLRSDASHVVNVDAIGYVSSDDAIVARRARRLLAAPPTVAISAKDGVLALEGHATAAWIGNARSRADWIPGVRSVAFGVAADSDPAASARAELEAIADAMPARRVTFERDVELAPGAAAVFEEIVTDALRAQALAATAGVGIEWIAAGTNDEPGSEAINAQLRAARARWLADALGARGIAHVRASGDDAEPPRTHERGAFLRLVVGAAAP